MPERRDADFDDAPASVQAARHFVVAALAAWGLGDLADDAKLLTSEVTTNALAHARTGFHLTVEHRDHDVLVEVSDGSVDLPQRRNPDIDDPGGRGLLIVDSFAGSWGCYRKGRGKVVWFTLHPVAQGGERAMLAGTA